MLLVRVGEFYETMGTDAVLLVQHAGLNQMGSGNPPRAGCPHMNLRRTLQCLVAANLSVVCISHWRYAELALHFRCMVRVYMLSGCRGSATSPLLISVVMHAQRWHAKRHVVGRAPGCITTLVLQCQAGFIQDLPSSMISDCT